MIDPCLIPISLTSYHFMACFLGIIYMLRFGNIVGPLYLCSKLPVTKIQQIKSSSQILYLNCNIQSKEAKKGNMTQNLQKIQQSIIINS